jgi:putative NADPH-quinone reductase/putative sterol carrier protein
MKKILLVNGSPRGRLSGSLRLAESFLEGYLEGEEAKVERIDLAEKNIRPCTGCYACWNGGRGACVQKDDMAALLPAYASADLVLIATPIYHFGMTALLKAFFERSLPLLYPYMVKRGDLYTHPARTRINSNRAFGLFSTCGFPDADNFRAMQIHFEKLLGQSLRFEFFCPEGEILRVPEMHVVASPRLAALKSAGAAFAATGAVPPESMAAVAQPMVGLETFVALANASWAAPGERPPSPAEVAGLEQYRPSSSEKAEQGGRDEEEAPSPAMLFLAQMAALFNVKAASGLEAVLQFDFTDIGETYGLKISKDGCALVPGSTSTATTRIIVPFATWKKISDGSLGGEEALMKGAYRVEGDFAIMMRMGELFGSSGNRSAEHRKRPNLMALAFVPWYFGWFLGGTSFWVGQALPLALALAFLVYRELRRESTWFERGTPIAFAFLCSLALASPAIFSARWSAFCNAAIAVVWGLSLAYRRPLTADYSKSGYSEQVASGLIFRKVNVGLTALWSALFLLEAAAGFLLTGVGQGSIAIASSILLIPAGVFTAWFPKWYPGHLARRGARKTARTSV